MVLVPARTAFGSRTTLFFIFINSIFSWFSKLQITKNIHRNIRCANTLILNIYPPYTTHNVSDARWESSVNYKLFDSSRMSNGMQHSACTRMFCNNRLVRDFAGRSIWLSIMTLSYIWNIWVILRVKGEGAGVFRHACSR